MTVLKTFPISSGRTLLIAPLLTLGEEDKAKISKRFAAMLPAFGNHNPQLIQEVVSQLVDLGCSEICCVGENSEALHDSIDWIVEEKGALQVLTTWDRDAQEGSDYFLSVAGGKSRCLLALIAECEALSAILLRSAVGS